MVLESIAAYHLYIGCKNYSPLHLIVHSSINQCLYHFHSVIIVFESFYPCRCIRTIIKGLRDDAGDKWDLSLLPPSVRNDLYQWNMTLSNGFAKEIHFLNLLPAHESIIKLNHTVVTDAMLDLIANRVVVELQIVSSRQEFSRKSLMDCISRMPQLERLVLCECDAVDDAFITMLSQYCLHLKHMVLEKCMNITDGCADALSKMRLRELDLSKSKVSNWIVFLCA